MTDDTALERTTLRRVAWRFIPLLMACYLFAYIDRVNVGFAAITANRDLGLSPAQFGFGAGLFFISYFFTELPSNLALVKFGAGPWLSRIMVTMGLIAAGMALVRGPWSFYVLRLALGAAEAGLFPGVVFFMSRWFPRQWRARTVALFTLSIPLSSLLGSPISGALLGLDGWLGLKGWQWLFVLEGVPCVILGLLLLPVLSAAPSEAHWLMPAQRDWLSATLVAERVARGEEPFRSWSLITDPRVLAYAAAFFGVTAGGYGLTLWLPLMVKAFGFSNALTGVVTAIPFGFGCVATILWGRHSDQHGERVWHTALAAFVAAAGLAACVFVTSPTATMLALSVAAVGIFGIRGPFWVLLAERFSGVTAAAGVALVSSMASLAGFAGPYFVGWFKQWTGSFSPGLLFLAALSLLGGVIVLLRARVERA